MFVHTPYSTYLQKTFGAKTYKVTVASGLGCPVKCDFCDIRGSSSFHGKQGRSAEICEQIQSRIPQITERFHAKKFLAHFQSYTNTYGELSELEQLYTEALAQPGIEGLVISTRPDCLPDPVIELLQRLARQHYVSLELGVQSFEDSTLQFIGRGHDAQCSLDALARLKKNAPLVHICAHLILGSPTDSIDAPIRAAHALNAAGVNGAKLHQLMILKGSELGRRWEKEPFSTVDLPAYCELIARFLEHLSPNIYIERLCATATHADECLAPAWSRGRWSPHNEIRKTLENRGCIQGSKI